MQLLPLKYKTISPLCFCKRAAQCYLKHQTPCISFSKKTSKTCSINYFRKLRSLSILHDERNLVLELENTNLLTIQWENMWQFLHLATITEGPGNPGGKQAGWSQEWQLPNYPSSLAEEKEEVFLEGLWLATAWTLPRPLKLKGLKNWKKKKKATLSYTLSTSNAILKDEPATSQAPEEFSLLSGLTALFPTRGIHLWNLSFFVLNLHHLLLPIIRLCSQAYHSSPIWSEFFGVGSYQK